MKIIHLGDALDEMFKLKVPFDITFIKCDIGRKTGGEIVELKNVMLSFNQDNLEKVGFEMPIGNVTDFRKKANHYQHATRNVILQNGLIKKFHIRLLLFYNGKKVFY